MTDPSGDDEALTWAGDERPTAAPARPALAVPPRGAPLGAVGLVVAGILGGVALFETIGWGSGVTSATMAATLDPGGGDPLRGAAFAINLAGRVAAVAAPVLWYAVAAWRIRTPGRRVAWQVLGALLLVPWPALLRLS
ncbi:MAG: hypothetical protein QOC59_902 [Microbacteriaceae bacterium]|nr:hypothetical protein [Microbacteriaceae bacterium]